MMRRLIVNGDDFGLCSAVNEAIERAHQEGILTSCSLMVNEPGFDEAVRILRRNPRLSVGLHLTLSDGAAALPLDEIPSVVDCRGMFPESPARAGLRYLFRRKTWPLLEKEIGAQFGKFAATGLTCSHVNGHQHLHIHPIIFPMVLRHAQMHHVSGVRIPTEPLLLDLAMDPRRLRSKLIWSLIFQTLGRWSRMSARRAGMHCPDQVFGLLRSKNMTEEYLLRLSPQLPRGTSEIFFHPSTAGEQTAHWDPRGPNSRDLATLLSPRVREMIQEHGIALSSYECFQKQPVY